MLINVPTVTIGGTAVTGTMAVGQPVLLAVGDPTGEDFNITMPGGASGSGTLLVGYEAIPTDNTGGNIGFVPFQFETQIGDSTLRDQFQGGQAGTYYVLINWEGPAASASYSFSASGVGLSVDVPFPSSAPAANNVTLTVEGTGFTSETRVSLVFGSTSIPADQVSVGSYYGTPSLTATFDLSGAPTASNYAVEVSDNGRTASTPATFVVFAPSSVTTVTTGEDNGSIVASLEAPSAVRPGDVYSLTVNYYSKGLEGSSVQAPILELSADNVEFQLPGQSSFTPGSIMLLGTNAPGQNNILGIGSATQPADLPGTYFCPITRPRGRWRRSGGTTAPPGIRRLLGFDHGELHRHGARHGELQPGRRQPQLPDRLEFGREPVTAGRRFQRRVECHLRQLHRRGWQYDGQPPDRARQRRQLPCPARHLHFRPDAVDGLPGRAGRRLWRHRRAVRAGHPRPGYPRPDAHGRHRRQGERQHRLGRQRQRRAIHAQPDGTYQSAPGDFSTLTLNNGSYQLRESNGTVEVFNSNGSLNLIEDANGDETVYSYTGGQLTSVTDTATGDVTSFTYNAQGLVNQITNPVGQITTLSYDSAGHLLSITNLQGTTSYAYVTSGTPQELNALASITNPDGSQVLYTHNSQGQLIGESQNGGADPLTFTYDVGEMTTTDALGDETIEFLDDNEQVVRTVDPLGNIIQGTLNDAGEPTSVTATGESTSVSYDALGDPISSVDPLGQETTATYNSTFDELQSITDPNGNTLDYSSDPTNGNLLSITYPDGSSQQYAYDATGEVTQFINRDGQAIAYAYNSQGLLTSETFPDGSQDTFTYDSQDNLISMTDATGTTTFAYNSADELAQVTYPDGTFLKYTYNSAGQRTQMTDQTGYTVNYQYDALGRLVELTDGSGDLIVSYSYNAVGELSSEQFGNGTSTKYSYDADGNVLSIVNLAPGGSTQSSYVYTYNNQSLPITMTTSAGTFTYGYDGDGQLISVQEPGGQTITYEYDADGNRVAVVSGGTTTQYTANDLDEYTQAGDTTYRYDADGDLISSTNSSGTTTYSYNVLGQLTSAVSPSGTTTYTYDALGQLVSENVNGTVTNLLNDPTGMGNIVGQFTASGSTIAQYAYGLGLVSQTDGAGDTAYYNFDLTGNTTQLTGAGGAVLDSYSYLPFGELLSSSGSTANPFTYAGELRVMNAGNGLYFMRNRFYDPALGRFTTPDPSGVAGGDVNLYCYTNNSPTASVDPLGLWSINVSSGLAVGPFGFEVDLSFGTGGLGISLGDNAGLGVNVVTVTASTGDVSAGPGTSTTVAAGLVVQSGNNGVTDGNRLGPLKPGNLLAPGTTVSLGLGLALGVSTSATNTGIIWPGPKNNNQPPPPNQQDQVNQVIQQLAQHDTPLGHSIESNGLLPPDQALAEAMKDTHTQVVIAGGFKFTVVNGKLVAVPASHDPNEITGPAGFGSQGFLEPAGPLPYRIDFTNESTASAPAATVVVTEQLSANLDWSTFQLGDIGFGSTVIQVPQGLTSYSTEVTLPSTAPGAGPDGLIVQVSASLNLATGLVTWTFTSLDPSTMDIPINPFEGFLPPDDSGGDGEGFVSYTVAPLASTTSDLAIGAQATVVFDTNAPISTRSIVNTIDTLPPASSVTALPATTAGNTINLSWSGSDGAGPGIATYSIFVSDNGGAFQPLLTDTTATSTTFTGQIGHTYRFFSIATDALGLTQTAPSSAQASTTLVTESAPPPPPPPVTVTSVHWQTLEVKTGAGKKAKTKSRNRA